jgi:DNA primase
LLRITTREAFDLLGAPDRRRAAETNLRIGTLKIPQGVGPLLPAHRAYLKKRGLNPDLLASVWGFRGIGIAPRLQWRIWIPICDLYGKVVSWTTRSIGDDPPTRYISATADEEELPHRSILFGAHLARHVIIVCEGALDAVTIGPGAVATCGVGFSKAQKAAMAEYPVRVVCFDAEDDAQKRARALCNDLSAFPGSTENVYFDSAKDANSADRAEVDELRKKYLPESLEIAA